DGSAHVVEEIAARAPSVRMSRNDRNLGVLASLNRLLDMATGTHVTIPAADDLVLPGFYEKSMNLLSRHSQAALCSGLLLEMDESGQHRRLVISACPSGAPAL